MLSDFSKYRQVLIPYIQDFLRSHDEAWQGQRWGNDAVSRFSEFSVTGKLVRGSLVLLAYELFSDSSFEPALPLAAAVECMHSALLIHDDYIDLDNLRRGKPSIPQQYRQLAQEKLYPNSTHVGNALSLCLGDIGFFWGFEFLSKIHANPEVYANLIKYFAREYQVVGLGEMDDIHLGVTQEPVTEAEILTVYRYKTARYTFVMPVVLAGILADADQELIRKLEAIGEKMGVIFQIKDDELGIFGTEEQIGKPVTSDVREGKKTLYYLYGLEKAQAKDKQVLLQAFGNPELNFEDLEKVREVLKKSGAVQAVATKVATLESEVSTLVTQLNNAKWQAFLQDFLNFNILRQH